MPEKTEEKIWAMRKDFAKNAGGHSNLLMIDGKGYEETHFNQPCCSPLTYCGKPLSQVFMAFGKETIAAAPKAKDWAEWFINDSLFAEAFITKDAKEGLKYGFEFDLEQDSNLIKAAVITFRIPFEWHKFAWANFVGRGFTEVEALALAHSVYVQKDMLVTVNHNSNHFVFDRFAPYSLFEEPVWKKSGETFKDGVMDNYSSTSNAWRSQPPVKEVLQPYPESMTWIESKDAFGSRVREPQDSLVNLQQILKILKGEIVCVD